MDDPELHGCGGQLLDRFRHGFGRSLHIRLDDKGQFFDLTFFDPRIQVIEGHARRACCQFRDALLTQASLGNVSCDAFIVDHHERFAGGRHAEEPDHLHRH